MANTPPVSRHTVIADGKVRNTRDSIAAMTQQLAQQIRDSGRNVQERRTMREGGIILPDHGAVYPLIPPGENWALSQPGHDKVSEIRDRAASARDRDITRQLQEATQNAQRRILESMRLPTQYLEAEQAPERFHGPLPPRRMIEMD